jgi:hypothetical protein
MNLRSFKSSLLHNPAQHIRFILPDGDPIPAEFHVTEVGHVVKNFIDCGGTIRSQESCLLQTWVAEDDKNHRLIAGKLARILDLSRRVVPSEDLEVEVEYETCAVSQYKIDSVTVAGDTLDFVLGHKKTDCLARESCGVTPAGTGCGCNETAGKCC